MALRGEPHIVTKIAFGGEDLTTAYAMSARQKPSPRENAPQPRVGDLFEFYIRRQDCHVH